MHCCWFHVGDKTRKTGQCVEHAGGVSKPTYPTQSSVSHHDLIAQNPFRTPEVLERTKATRLRAMRDSARGPKCLSVDFKVCCMQLHS